MKLAKTDLRTAFSYLHLTKAIKDEFHEFLDEFFDPKIKQIRRENGGTFHSKNHFFTAYNNSFYIVRSFYSDEPRDYGIYSSKALLIEDDTTRIRSVSFSQTDKETIRHNKFRVLLHEYLIRDNFADRTFEEVLLDNEKFLGNVYYEKRPFLSSEIQESISHKTWMPSYQKWVHPYGYCNFRLHETEKNMMQFDYRGRTTTLKIGKGVKKIYKIIDKEISDEEVKQLYNRLSGSFDDFEFRVVRGEDITKYYNGSQYDDSYNTGSLAGSCMRYDNCGERNFFEVYEDNCEMLIYVNKNTDLIIGRAILWTAEDIDEDCEVTVMDRIYSSEKVYLKFFDYAKENEIYRKRYQSYDDEKNFVDWEGFECDKNFELNFLN